MIEGRDHGAYLNGFGAGRWWSFRWTARIFRWVTVAGLLASAPAGAVDLKSIIGGVTQNAGKILHQRDALLGNVTSAQERQMGRAAVAVLLGAAPLVKDRQAQAYINRVGLWIAMQSERPTLPWRFGILDDHTINAFAAPGGYVLVTRGLFVRFRSESELAGVLAHEIAHVLARHHVNAMVAKARSGLLLDIAKDASGHQGVLPNALLAATKSLYASGLDQGDEFEADRMGVALAARAGYDPRGLSRTLTALKAVSGNPQLLGFMTSTHPPFGQRISTIERIMAGGLGNLSGKSPTRHLAAAQARLR